MFSTHSPAVAGTFRSNNATVGRLSNRFSSRERPILLLILIIPKPHLFLVL